MAAESWGPQAQEVETLSQQMSRWTEQMVANPEGSIGFASKDECDRYRLSYRTPAAGGPQAEAAAGTERAPRALNGASMFMEVAGRVLDHLGLHPDE